jgi:hypothetical protein
MDWWLIEVTGNGGGNAGKGERGIYIICDVTFVGGTVTPIKTVIGGTLWPF